MRIAVISDVHGNLTALDAVLADLADRHVEMTVNLGDIVSGGVQPRETAERLMALDLPTVRGNHERQVLETPPDRMGKSDRLAHDSISEEHRAWLASLPLTLEIAPGALAFHGSPTNDLTYLLETVEPTGARAATAPEVVGRLGTQVSRPLLLCGHTHLQRSIRLSTGAFIVNPGSVGWPAYEDDFPYPHVMQAGTPHARYAIVDDEAGRWAVSFEAVQYDWESAARVAESNSRPDVARALRTGLV
ncbi:MAG: YfcE family phosphodiesterase [Pseudonocardiales bacterium]|nr:MAG: YfcE family phosphodiesterase [Pseudonocardiales bacterium]